MDPDRIDPDITDKADKLIESYLPYAAKIASRFLDRGLPYLDLCQAAALGLTKAARRFDPSYGVDFAVYSFKFIEGEIRSAVRKSLTLYCDGKQTESAAGETRALPSVIPIDALIVEGQGSNAFDLKDPNSDFEMSSARQIFVRSMLDELLPDERKLIILRFFHCLSQKQTGRLIGLSQSQVSRNEKAILHKLRSKLKTEDSE